MTTHAGNIRRVAVRTNFIVLFIRIIFLFANRHPFPFNICHVIANEVSNLLDETFRLFQVIRYIDLLPEARSE
jgi:hypothetical protein